MKMIPSIQFTDKLFVWEKKNIKKLIKMLIKLWIVSTRKRLTKPTCYLLEVVCTAQIEIFGAGDGSSYLCHSCYYWIRTSRHTLVLFSFWSDKVRFPLKLRVQIKKEAFSEIRYFMSRWTLSVSMMHLSPTADWLKLISHFKAHISFKPTMAQQRKCPTCSSTAVDGNFVVQYDVNRENTGGELEVSVAV